MPSIVWAVVCYLLVAIAVTFPLALSLDVAVSDPVDAILNTWIMAFEHHTLLTRPLEFLNANIFYPHQQTLLFSETLLLPSLLLLPVRLATGSALLTHNMLVLMGFVFTGTGGYVLGRWLFRSHWPALAVGGVLAFNTFTLSNVGQAQLLHLEWLPLALLYMGKLLRRPSLRSALLMAVFLAAQFYSVIYYGIFSFLVTGLVGGVAWLFGAYPSMRQRLRAAYLMAVGLVVAIALCLPLALAYAAISATYGFERVLADIWPYSASLQAWTTALESNLLYGSLLGSQLPTLGFYALDALFPGALLLSLAAIGLGVGLGRAWGSLRLPGGPARRPFLLWPLFLLGGIVFFFLLSLGPYLQQEVLQPDFDQLLPYALIHDWVPGFHALRAPARFAFIVFLGLALAAAYALQAVRWRVAKMALFLLLMVEVLVVPSTTLYSPQTSDDQAAAYAWLATLPATTYLEFPLYPFGEAGQEAYWLESQFQSIKHWQATPVGYSGFFPPRYEELVEFLSGFPRAEVVHLLETMGVEWILLHRARIVDDEWQQIEQAIDAQGWHVQKWGDVWGVQLPIRNAERTGESPTQSFYLPDVAQAGGMMTIGALLSTAKPTSLVPGSDLGRIQVEWWRGDRQVLVARRVVQPPYFMHSVATSTFQFPAPLESDVYALKVLAGEPPQEVASGMVNVVDDVAPPEITLLPVRGIEAHMVCNGDAMRADVLMETNGWYDESFTLSGRMVDANGVEVARSAADVEFPPVAPRRNLLHQEPYALPFDVLPFDLLPEANNELLSLEVYAYRWQQSAERIVARYFVDGDGMVVDSLRLPLTFSSTCEPDPV